MDWKIAKRKRSVRDRPGMIVVLRDWMNLPSELIESILAKLDFNFVDVIRFGAVCKRWYNITLNRPPLHSFPPQLPWLLLSSPDTKIESPFRFHNTSDNKIYSLPPPPYATTTSSLSRSNIGWFFMFENDTKCSFVNPLTRQQFALPPTRRSYFLPQSRLNFAYTHRRQSMKSLIHKAVFSSPPGTNDDDDCLVMAITRYCLNPLLFCKVGDKEWKVVVEHKYSRNEIYQDVIYFKGQFYAIDLYSRVVVCDLSGYSPVTRRISPYCDIKAENTYLVDVSAELVLVALVKEEGTENAEFHIFQYNSLGPNWTTIEHLGDQAIFLGFNHSVSVLASNYPGCEANNIYFTDNDQYQQYDLQNAVLGDSTTKVPVYVTTSL